MSNLIARSGLLMALFRFAHVRPSGDSTSARLGRCIHPLGLVLHDHELRLALYW